MKNLLFTTAILALIGFWQPALAHGDEKHDDAATHSVEATLTKEQALAALQDGITMMEKTVSDAHRAEMFNDGPIMEQWHEKVAAIEEASSVLRKHSATLAEDKKKRLEGALNQLSKVLDDFHMATHEKDAKKSQAEVTKAKGALKLVESNIK
jgi:hypothetical protein